MGVRAISHGVVYSSSRTRRPQGRLVDARSPVGGDDVLEDAVQRCRGRAGILAAAVVHVFQVGQALRHMRLPSGRAAHLTGEAFLTLMASVLPSPRSTTVTASSRRNPGSRVSRSFRSVMR